MRIFFCLASLILISKLAIAQSSSSEAYYRLADSLFQYHNYQHAAEYYQKALKKSKDQGQIMLSIGSCYRKLNNIKSAELWYKNAQANAAQFTDADIDQFVQVLVMSQKRNEAEAILIDYLKKNPNDSHAKAKLDDLDNYGEYYKDSLSYTVTPLSINTPNSEFAPAFYKEGIAFLSAQQRGLISKKYHYDNSYFLRLNYSPKIIGSNFKKPELLAGKLDARYHDGPVSFYKGGERMIITLNQMIPVAGQKDTYKYNLALFDAEHSHGKSNEWVLTPLPFNDPSASFAHPFISEDGNVLYFISDMPGGYGGTDIYQIVKTNGEWGKPFNLGSAINTIDNEVFPFFVDGTLYFASEGHGGLGGMDIFKSHKTVNGFTLPANMGYPINTHLDDFGFIARPDQMSGYLSSARQGSDDLFTFDKRPDMLNLSVTVYDGENMLALPQAEINVVADIGHDTTLVSNDSGIGSFQIRNGATYLIVVSKDSKVGMISGSAITGEDQTMQSIVVYGDTTRVACLGLIKDEAGLPATAFNISIKDETTGKSISHRKENSTVSFLGWKNHVYKVIVANELGDTIQHTVNIKQEDIELIRWTMILKKSPDVMTLAARVFNENNNQPLPGANVTIISLANPDLDLTANAAGVVEFELPLGTAFMALASSGNLTGMISGVAEAGFDKESIINPIPVKGDPGQDMPFMLLITDEFGEILKDADAMVVSKATGKKIPSQTNDGVLTFHADTGAEYTVTVSKRNYEAGSMDVTVSEEHTNSNKATISLKKTPPIIYQMAARVFKAEDKSPLPGAEVKITTLDSDDLVMIANDSGFVNFLLPEGTAYVALASKDGYSGMHSGIVEPGTDRLSIIHPIEAHGEPFNTLPVVSFVTNEKGEMLTNAVVNVTEHTTGEYVTSEFNEGALTFYGEKGKSYHIDVAHKDHASISTVVRIPEKVSEVDKINIEMAKQKPAQFAIAARIIKSTDQSPLAGAQVKVMTSAESDLELTANDSGVVDFTLADGTAYIIIADKDGFSGMHSGIAEKGNDKPLITHTILAHNDAENQIPVISFITDPQGEILKDAKVDVTEQSTGKKVLSEFNYGVLNFYGEKGVLYDILVTNKGHEPATMRVQVPDKPSEGHNVNITLNEKKPVTLHMAARIVKSSDESFVSGAQVTILASDAAADVELTSNEAGIVNFMLPEGTAYIIIADKEGFSGMHSGIAEKDGTSTIRTIAIHSDAENELPIVSFITDKEGTILRNAKVNVTEQNTGKKVSSAFTDGVLSFYGEKGNAYNILVTDKGYESSSTQIVVPEKATDVKEVKIALAEQKVVAMQMAARVLKSTDQSALAGAQVTIMTADVADIVLTADDAGVVDFALAEGTAYVIIADRDGFSGMYSGMAEKGNDKASTTHIVIAHGDTENKVPVVSFVSGPEGEVLHTATVNVTEQKSGKEIPSEFIDGVLNFYADKGQSYLIEVDHPRYKSTSTQVVVSEHAELKEVKIEMVKEQPASLQMSARVVKSSDQSALAGAHVNILTSEDADVELTANESGVVDFNLAEGEAYIIIADKDGMSGMHSGIAEKGSDKASITHKIVVQGSSENKIPVVSFITNQDGVALTNAKVNVTEQRTGKTVSSAFTAGVLSFYGEQGNAYTILVNNKGYKSESTQLVVPNDPADVKETKIELTQERSISLELAARIVKLSDNSPVSGAQVTILASDAADVELISNEVGVVNFMLPEGTAYIIIADKEGFSGMHSGIAEKDDTSTIRTIAIHSDVENELPIVSFITDKEGTILPDAKVNVTEQNTGKKVSSAFTDGVLSFYGETGNAYNILVTDKGYESSSTQIVVPEKATDVKEVKIALAEQKVVTMQMAARVLKSTDQSALAGAQVTIMTADVADIALTADDAGVVDFTLAEGTAYVIIADRDGFSGMYSGMAEKGNDKASTTHIVVAHGDTENKVPVVSFVTNQDGERLSQATVNITEQQSGKNIPREFADGVLTFYADEAKSYNVTVTSDGYQSATSQVSVAGSMDVKEFKIELVKEAISKANEVKNKPDESYQLNARVIKSADNTPVAGANVKMITFDADDRDVVTNDMGVTSFSLTKDSPYVLIASKDGLSGMVSGLVQSANEAYDLAMKEGNGDLVPVVGLLSAYDEKSVGELTLTITAEATGKPVEFIKHEGVVTFMGEKGMTYNLETTLGSSKQAKQIQVNRFATKPIQWKLDLHENTAETETLVIFNNHTQANRYFLFKMEGSFEIIADANKLYLLDGKGKVAYCDGSLEAFDKDPKQFAKAHHLQLNDVVRIQNIYFDFDSAILNEQDKAELDKIGSLLQHHADYKLRVSTHADDRGHDSYNQRLSEKRASSIVTYLSKAVSSSRLVTKAYGEGDLAVSCGTSECSEDDHKINRRAEFSLLFANVTISGNQAK